MSNQKKSFLDSNTILAMALTFMIFIGWQKYMESKYPPVKRVKITESVAGKINNVENSVEKDTQLEAQALNVEAKTISFENDSWSFKINSRGMSVDDVIIKKINRVAKIPYVFKNAKSFYATALDGKILNFDFKKVDENTFKGTAVEAGKTIIKTVFVDSSRFDFKVTIEIKGNREKAFSIDQVITSKVQAPKNKIFFLPAFQRNEFFVSGDNDEERKILTTDLVLDTPEEYPGSDVVSIGDEYFAAALLNTGKILPKVTFNQNNDVLNIAASYEFTELVQVNKIEYELFIGPKSVDLLSSVSPRLDNLINFMYLGVLARPILRGLNLLYDIFGNYGWAVVILTLLIRLLIMPLTVSSLKSMKRMQAIQPQLKKIKEKYKDQPQVVNQKTMDIMKQNKVNPLGGCLPMLLQMPIFFAFYRGLSESVDLYQAPFFGWITDLSVMDPYFIFPVLSMVGMVLHQLVTPSNMEPMQKKMMLFMPVVFGIFFVTLPSALTIYMAIGAWFGILQHTIFLRDKAA